MCFEALRLVLLSIFLNYHTKCLLKEFAASLWVANCSVFKKKEEVKSSCYIPVVTVFYNTLFRTLYLGLKPKVKLIRQVHLIKWIVFLSGFFLGKSEGSELNDPIFRTCKNKKLTFKPPIGASFYPVSQG